MGGAGRTDPAIGVKNGHEAALHLPWWNLRVTLFKNKILVIDIFFCLQETDNGAEDKDASSTTVTSETTSGTSVTTTTTHISKVSMELSFRTFDFLNGVIFLLFL